MDSSTSKISEPLYDPDCCDSELFDDGYNTKVEEEKQEKETIFLATDLEPDDILAILTLYKKISQGSIEYVLVSEGKALKKVDRIFNFFKILKKYPIIIQGLDSEKSFKKEGEEFLKLKSKKEEESSEFQSIIGSEPDFLKNFEKFSQSENPIFICLKPLKELFQEFQKNKDFIKKLVSNVKLYCYGGFNFRDTIKVSKTATEEQKKQIHNDFIELLSSFKETYIYESYYATGSQNSVNKETMPELYKYINEKTASCYNVLKRLILNWNENIKEGILAWIDKVSDEERKRKQKILDNLKGHEDFQLVLADFGLTTAYMHNLKAKLVKNLKIDPYLTFETTEEKTNLFVYKDIGNFETMEKLILSVLP
jgi:hypothetical protein